MMHWNALISYVVLVSLYINVLSQESDEQQLKENIIKQGYDASVELLRLFYKKDNVIFSPFNIRVAMALVHSGADGNTRDEIANFIGFPKDTKKIQQAHKILSQILKEVENTRVLDVRGEHGVKPVKVTNINNANGIFIQDGIELLPSYKSDVQSFYKSEAANVDFATQSAKATDTINEYVSKHTNGRIPKLFSNPLDSDTVILIAACLYFKATWDNTFSEFSTKQGFFSTTSSKVTVNYMQQTDEVPYINIASLKLEAISLHYAGRDASMFFVLPYENQTLDAVISSLKGDVLREITKKMKNTYVQLQIPKKKYKWSEDINNHLKNLGVKDVFASNAKLNNIANGPLRVSKVTHAAEIEINEKGTEASAVTVVQIIPESAIIHFQPPIPFHVNRPFIFFIYHHNTESVLFIGTVHNP